MDETRVTYPNPNRPPKKYPQKDLHGRVRGGGLGYHDLKTFQDFYINVFGWDMFALPVSAGGNTDPEHPNLIVATAPAQYDWEGLTPGHVFFMAMCDAEGINGIDFMMEMHSDPNIDPSDTLQEIASHGGRVVFDNSKEPGIQPWARKFVIEDPSGNHLRLWKCSASRTWDELETQLDETE